MKNTTARKMQVTSLSRESMAGLHGGFDNKKRAVSGGTITLGGLQCASCWQISLAHEWRTDDDGKKICPQCGVTLPPLA